ncbi:PqqD family protein [Aerophototrophica crusticola]|uniref:PqqD family protein n=1 Tax=Aerophototrophica crusticola TaxID=1709002 RepID=A0A858R7A6_9PROT|nr:PqqD family protein [Rhodospirillaceae bacterium B3]
MAAMDLDTVVAQCAGLVMADIGGNQKALMDVETGTYFVLNPLGADIWARLETPRRVADLCEELCTAYAVEREICRADTLAFLGRLQRDNLVRADHAQASQAA